MTIKNNRKTEYDIYWLGAGDELDLSRVEKLHQNNLNVVAFSEFKSLQGATVKHKPNLLVIANYADVARNIDFGLNIKSNQDGNEINFLLITESLDKETKDYFYQSGGNELLLEPASLIEIFFRIKHSKFIFDQKNNASMQIAKASQMALLAMENSRLLDKTINFVQSAARCNDYESMAKCIFSAVKDYSDSAMVEMTGAESFYYFGSHGAIDPDLKQLLLSQKNETRIVYFENTLQMNHDYLILIAEGLPIEDSVRMERIADNLAILIDTADRFVSELLLREQSIASELAKQRFISTISHELNTPLNAIMGFSKLIAAKGPDEILGDKGVTALNSIGTNSEKMQEIIQTLIDITGEQSKLSQLSKDEIEVSNIILHLKNSCSPLVVGRPIRLIFPRKINIQLKSDQKHLIKMLFNLIDNAIKFTDKGEVELEVSQALDKRRGNVIQFCVKDTGIGISKKNASKLFKHLGQLDVGHDRKHYGAGLGLFYVQSFVKQLNGKIEVNSIEGKGSEFTLTVPTNLEQISDNTELF